MCTVTLVPHDAGLTVICNRDERHARPAALAPITRRFGATEATLPIDAQGGGTWIAANSAGLVMALLNRRSRASPVNNAPASRGLVIPALLASATMQEAVGAAMQLDAAAYQPFTLVIADVRQVATATSNGVTVALDQQPLLLPVMFTSSSLDEPRAIALRGRLFRRMVVSARDRLAAQQEFHAHQWPDCAALSVRMWRPDARTVSRTTVRISASALSLRYDELPPPVEGTLP